MMAYSHLGYSYSGAPQFLMSSGSLTSCLEQGGRALVDTLTSPSHSALSCPVYEGRVLRSPGHDLPTVTGIGIYSSTYPKGQGYYNTCSGDAPSLYSRNPLDSKEGAASAHMGTSQVAAYCPYEYTFGQYPYDRYRYSGSDGASRRKNATRETTSTLKAWLQEHQKNPYPTKGEKIMLAIITRMTLTQVSTWFANARRRLKKENKVTWSLRACKNSEDRGCGDDDSDGAAEPIKREKEPCDRSVGDLQSDLEDFDLLESDGSDSEPKTGFVTKDNPTNPSADPETQRRKERISSDCPKLTQVQHQGGMFRPLPDLPIPETKLKIWSIAHSAVSTQPELQAEYPPCMLSSAGSSPRRYPSRGGLAVPDRRQDSPVATLRDWVDGVFHDGPFQHRLPQQALAESSAVWEGQWTAARRTAEHI